MSTWLNMHASFLFTFSPAGPPKPQPTPSNTPARQQRQRQWGAQSQQLVHFRQQLWQGSAAAAAEPQGLHVSRWLATADADVLLDSHSLASSTGGTRPPSQDAGEAQQQQQQQQVPPIGTDPARSGELPYSWFAAYPHLVHLRVVGCGAAGALQGGRIAGAKRLASLVLSHNKLQGTLPDEFVGLQVGWGDGWCDGVDKPICQEMRCPMVHSYKRFHCLLLTLQHALCALPVSTTHFKGPCL